MCSIAYYVHPGCHCRWLRITRRCAPGRGFSTCPHLLDGTARLVPPAYRSRLPGFVPGGSASAVDAAFLLLPPPSSACPLHDLHGCYDRNDIRRVLDVQNGMRWGSGPNREDVGVEWNCCIL
ncbi:hypothetical protein CMQ_7846 [Grosmannia clavigera kw1407]|uniref:Uncharacterized protein n=1 Tax=Grosmannia clavigera (strain kw1407 / UAMH 11150) TaxID=655863 RepID=F0XSB3_GROCL|nr:uncharacterized protein CMQ_7846 [Grosmannia clavigera kw1407]EFW99478.1 hypothetical protein CMQ_7846 [Grosmannia clavigera kw1407]